MSGVFDLGLRETDRVANSLGGGIPKGSLVLLEGDSGSGKSVWAQRFAYGICNEGNDVTYISAEENARSFIDQMASLSYDVTEHLLNQNMLFLRADTETEPHLRDGENRTGHLVQDLIESEVPWRSDLIVVDNFEELLLNDKKFDQYIKDGEADHAMQTVRTYFEKMMKQGKTVIVCVNSENAIKEAIRPLRSFSTIHIQFSEKTVGGNVRRTAHIKQYKNMPGSVEDKLSFGVRAGQGLSIETRTVA